MYYTYMIRCIDNSIYTGITTDLERRMKEHFTQDEKCAKYTKRHKAKKLEAVWTSADRKLASKLEYHMKHLTKLDKENIIKDNGTIRLSMFHLKIHKFLYHLNTIKYCRWNMVIGVHQ